MTNPRPPLVLAPLVLAAACGDAGRDGPGGGGGDAMLNAVTEDVFTVGSVAGDGWDTFGSVQGVAFDDEGNLHVFDRQAAHILVIGPDGSLLRTVGGRGEGPGEFGRVTSALVARDGSYTVLGFSQIDLLGPGGTFERRIPLDAILISDVALPDGRLVTSRYLPWSEDVPDVEGRPIHVFPLDGGEPEVLYTAWELPEDPDAGDADPSSSPTTISLSAGRAFEPGLHFDALGDGRLALADSIGYRVKLIGPGGNVTGVVERPIAPLPVGEAAKEAERERYRETTTRLTSGNVESLIQVEREGEDELVFADELPVIARLKVDWDDRIWVTRTGADGSSGGPTDIVTADGRYVGTLPADGLRTPHGFGPDGLMAYIERDEMDVPTVRVIRLVSLER